MSPASPLPSGLRAALRVVAAALALSLVLAAGSARAQQPAKPAAPDIADFVRLPEVGSARISPDGKAVAVVVSRVDWEKNRRTTELRLYPTEGGDGGGKALPIEAAGIERFLWSPKGDRIAYIGAAKSDSAKTDKPAEKKPDDAKAADPGTWIWLLDPATGENRKIVRLHRSNHYLAHAGASWCFSPDGTQIAYLAADADAPSPAVDPRVITRIQYRNRTGFSDNKNTHVHVVELATGKSRKLTDGKFDEHSIDWSPDGAVIVFCSNRSADPDANLNYDLYAVRVADGAVRRLTDTPGSEMSPVWSPDGLRLAFLKTSRPLTTIDSVAEDDHVWVLDLQTKQARDLTAELDRRCSQVTWGEGGRAVYFLARDRGKTLLYRVPADGGAATPIFDDEAAVHSFSLRTDGEDGGAYVRSTAVSPAEVARFNLERRLRMTEVNTAIAQKWSLCEPRELNFKSADGTAVHGWLYLPQRADEKHKAPMILFIHGGPHGMWGWGFNWRFQALVARGYAVLAINPRGSSGYGQKFSDGCVKDWGGGDWRDLMAGVDHVIEKFPEIDRRRLGVTGPSYGGYMTMWAVTQTDRFQAAVAYAGLSNLISFYGTSLYQDLVHVEFGRPWDQYKLLWERSPLAHIRNAKTPTLLIHGESDIDVPIGQSEEFFAALKQLGVPAEFVRYPRQGHGPTEPKQALDDLKRTAEWFDKWLKPGK